MYDRICVSTFAIGYRHVHNSAMFSFCFDRHIYPLVISLTPVGIRLLRLLFECTRSSQAVPWNSG